MAFDITSTHSKLVAEARAAFQVRGPVARIHVADADQVGRPGKGEHAPPEGDLRGADGGVNVGEGPSRVLTCPVRPWT